MNDRKPMAPAPRAASDVAPALPHMAMDGDGGWYLGGQRCGDCGVVVEGQRLACPACGARRNIASIRLASLGSVATCSLIHRSYPGVAVPFYAVVVDLDGGATVRGTLGGVNPSPDMPAGLRVAMVFGDSGQRDTLGRALIAYHFVPAERRAS